MSHRLSRDQKRKKKLAKRTKFASPAVAPYEGRKYEGEEFVEALFRAECGILTSYVITEKKLTDWQVMQSLEYLVLELQGCKPLQPPEDCPEMVNDDGTEENLVVSLIKQQWEELFQDSPPHSPADLAGILRKIMKSIKLRTGNPPHSQRYLVYLEGFLRKAGFSVEVADEPPDDY